jgi:hypothetical protein
LCRIEGLFEGTLEAALNTELFIYGQKVRNITLSQGGEKYHTYNKKEKG